VGTESVFLTADRPAPDRHIANTGKTPSGNLDTTLKEQEDMYSFKKYEPTPISPRLRTIEIADLVPTDVAAWRDLRKSLERRQATRAWDRRFRRDPQAYLRSLEEPLINQTLPS